MQKGLDIIQTDWTGFQGMLEILEVRREELESRFDRSFLDEIKKRDRVLIPDMEEKIKETANPEYIREVAFGGIFSALWKLTEKMGTGIRIDLKKIPIRQETIEICEYYGLNPYQLYSGNSYLIAASDSMSVTDKLAEWGVPCSVIGKVTEGKDRAVYRGEDIRYLNRPEPDELEKIMKREKGC